MMSFSGLKATKFRTPSDIVTHLPILEKYAAQCDHVTELGVRDGNSTVALVAGCRGEVHSYDVSRTSFVDLMESMELPCRWFFHQGDTLNHELAMAPTELLFVDTLHTYEHVKRELALWGRLASRYLIFHDTFTCGDFDKSGPNPKARGIGRAIDEFVAEYGDYEVEYKTDECNGLLVLRGI